MRRLGAGEGGCRDHYLFFCDIILLGQQFSQFLAAIMLCIGPFDPGRAGHHRNRVMPRAVCVGI